MNTNGRETSADLTHGALSEEAVSDGLEDLPVDVHDGLVYIFKLDDADWSGVPSWKRSCSVLSLRLTSSVLVVVYVAASASTRSAWSGRASFRAAAKTT